MSVYPSPLGRLLEPLLADRMTRSPVVVISGARQTGKTTLVSAFSERTGRSYSTLDSISTLDRAQNAPESLVGGDLPITIDEVQRAPRLLLAIKKAVDDRRRPGRFLLTGSANLLLMRGVSETLAGRAVHLTLRPMSEREKRGESATPSPWSALLSADDAVTAARALAGLPRDSHWKRAALEGGLPPAALASSAVDRRVWFDGYVETYVHRDLRDLAQVGDLSAFVRFAKMVMLRAGGLLNATELGRDAGVSRATAQRWLAILDTSYLATLLQPFSESRAKRLIKTPKIYAGDTGLGLHMSGILSEDDLAEERSSGAWLENLVLNDVLAWRETESPRPEITYRRTVSGEEVDLVVEKGRRLLPVEVKASSHPRVHDAKALDAFCSEFPKRAPFAVLLYDGREPIPLTKTTLALPLGAIL